MPKLRTAIVHDWLLTAGGAERVLARLCYLLPQADVFCILGRRTLVPEPVRANRFAQSWLKWMPGASRYYRLMAPLMPSAVESIKLKGYDLVISSSWAFSHGVITDSSSVHLAYIHSPMRWAWDMQDEYLDRWSVAGPLKRCAQIPLAWLRRWDRAAAQRPDMLWANSRFIEDRIAQCWQRRATVLYPPVAIRPVISEAAPPEPHGAYVAVSRLVPYKRVDLIVAAFNRMPQRQLIVAGDGPEMSRLKTMAGPNIRFTGWVTDQQAITLMSGSRGFIQASKEDFGIAVVEAQACGIPVLAYAEGGARETIATQPEHKTGMLFDVLTPEALEIAVEKFERESFRAEDCRHWARQFSVENFDRGFLEGLAPFGMPSKDLFSTQARAQSSRVNNEPLRS